jgi:hypothetical protein
MPTIDDGLPHRSGRSGLNRNPDFLIHPPPIFERERSKVEKVVALYQHHCETWHTQM